jgi:hypothetical protein
VYCFPEADLRTSFLGRRHQGHSESGFFVDNLRTVWLLTAGWIALSLAVFFAVDASSSRSWIYLAAGALLPPVALIRLWPVGREQTIDDVIHGRPKQS